MARKDEVIVVRCKDCEYPHNGETGCPRIFGRVGVTGHSHMDTAWLWPVSETVRKCARTYANALSLMDQYPEYTFMQSSALHGEWMKNYYPTIFEDMKKRVAEGRLLGGRRD